MTAGASEMLGCDPGILIVKKGSDIDVLGLPDRQV